MSRLVLEGHAHMVNRHNILHIFEKKPSDHATKLPNNYYNMLCFRTVDPARLRCTRWSSRKFNGIKYCGSLKNRIGPFSRCLAKKVCRGYIGYIGYSFASHVK